MVADWVTQGLARTGLVEVVPSRAVMASARAPEGHGAGHLDAGGIRSLGKETGAGTVVSGAYYRQGDSIRFQLQISDAQDGKVLRALDPTTGPLTKPLAAVEMVRQRVMAALATLFDPRLSEWATTASQPPSFESYQEFVEGLDRLVQSDWRGAIGHFERAAAGDSTFRVPLIFAAAMYLNLGEFAAADSIAHAVERAPGRLAPLDRRYLAWVLAQARGDREGALQTSREMAVLAPGSEALYLVAQDAMALNRPREAAAAFTELGPERGFFRGWHVYWNDLTTVRHTLGDHHRELKEALEGRKRFPDLLATLAIEVRALAALGRTADVGQRLAAGETLPRQPGWTPADVALLAGLELRAHGHPAAAQEALDRAIRWLEKRSPEESQMAGHRYSLALAYYLAGRLEEAQRGFERLAAGASGVQPDSFPLQWVAASMGDLPDRVNYLGYLGAIAARRGNRDEALKMARALQGTDRPYLFGRHTMWQARIQALLGDRDSPIALIREAFGRGFPHAHSLHTDPAFQSLRSLPSFQELLKPKG